MRPYKCNNKWVDLDHVLVVGDVESIFVSFTLLGYTFNVTAMFLNEPIVLKVKTLDDYYKFLDEWSGGKINE